MRDELSPSAGVERGCGRRQTTIYGLLDPDRPGDIRYVGKTINLAKRVRHHEWMARRGAVYPVYRWYRKVLRAGRAPAAVVLEVVEGEGWAEAERRWIASFSNLTNISRGGEGVDAPRTPEWRRRISDAHRGKVFPEDVADRLSELNRSRNDAGCKRGHAWTPENTGIRRTKTGRPYRCCLACMRLLQARWRRKQGIPRREEWEAGLEPAEACKRGHPLSGDNLRIMERSNGKIERICRECVRIRNRETKRRRRERSARG